MLKLCANALGAAMDEWGATRQVARFQLQANWPEMAGAALAEHSQPQRLHGRTLWVMTRGPIWSQEIALRQNQILERLEQRFPRLGLNQLRCRVGTLRQTGEPPLQERQPDLSQIPLSPAGEARAQALAALIEDPGLRRSALRALRQSERRKQWLLQQGAQSCLECGALQDFRLCLGCRQERGRERRRQLFQLLGREPWLTLQEAQQRLSRLTQNQFHTARRQLLSNFRLHFYQLRDGLSEGQPLPKPLRQVMLEICMLATATPWDQLQDRHVRYSLGRTWGIAYLEDRAPAPYVPDPNKKRAGAPFAFTRRPS